jgi:D-3-phosphoglycerate dehydrogenase
MWSGPTKGVSIQVDVEGPAFEGANVTDLMKAALLKGLLPTLPSVDIEASDVNLVNAALLADEVHLKVAVKQSPSPTGPYASAIRVTVVGPSGSRSVVGSVIEGQPRVVQVDHWQSFPTFAPEGHVVLFNNFDKPGAVGKVTSVLADNNINIASLAIARQYIGSPALSVIITDQRVPSEVKAKIADLDGISNVSTASFGNQYITKPAE